MPSPDFSQYIDLTPLDVNPADIYTGAIELARLTMPEFTLRQGTPEDAIFQAMAFMSGITAGAINRLPSRLMVGVANLLGYSRYTGSRATVSATITLADYDEATIPRGTIFGWLYEEEDGELTQYAFELTENIDIAAGTPPTLPTGTASLRSVIPGFLPTVPAGTELSIVTTNTAILSAITTSSFVNGIDPETDSNYLASLTTYIQSLSSSIATANQIESTVLTSFREVNRCKTYDLTDPSGTLLIGDPDEPGFATIFVYGRNRQMTSQERSEIQLFIEDKINVGIVEDVLEANICGVGVRADVVYDNRYDEAEVISDISFGLQTFLSPESYPSFDSPIRINSVIAQISRAPGVLYVSSAALRPVGDVFTERQWTDVRAATTANITISTALNAGDVIDGITLVDGDRILVKNQSTGSQNGIYIVGASPARATDADATAEFIENKLVYVVSGTANAGTYWKQTTSGAVTVGTTAISFGSASGHQILNFVNKGSLPSVSLGSIDLNMTGESA